MTYLFPASDNDKFTNNPVKKNWKTCSKTDEIYQTTDIRSSENQKQGKYKETHI